MIGQDHNDHDWSRSQRLSKESLLIGHTMINEIILRISRDVTEFFTWTRHVTVKNDDNQEAQKRWKSG